MKTLPLSRGLVAIVDDDVHEWASKVKWTALRARDGRRTYVTRRSGPAIARRAHYLHREIMQAARGVKIDHVNGDGLDNRRQNLRVATTSQNGMNQRTQIRRGKTSRFKGVSWFAQTKKWQAGIRVSGKGRGLGYFVNEDDAARAYDAAARREFGRFAALNFPRDGEIAA